MTVNARILLVLSLWCVSALCSCSTLVYRHLPTKNVSVGQRDTINHQMKRAVVHVTTKRMEYQRKPGYVQLQRDSVLLASPVLLDTLRISLDSIITIRCVEDLPLGTTVAATVGGALGGFLFGKAVVSKSNTDFPIGMSIIGGVLGGFAAIESSKETVYRVSGQTNALPTR